MKVGFIGLGVMGRPMARNLLKAGYELTVYNRSHNAAVDELAAAGAAVGTSCADVAARSDVVVTMVPNSPHVREVLFGANGVADAGKAGLDIIDMSSIAPLASRELAEECARRGMHMMDAPVSGG